MSDAMKGYNYITIADHIDEVDWSTVKVDTPVLVKDYEDNAWTKRHFAFYKKWQSTHMGQRCNIVVERFN